MSGISNDPFSDPMSVYPNFENKLNRLGSRPLREKAQEGAFAMRARCFEEIFIVFFKDLEGVVEDLGKGIYFAVDATFTPDVIKATEYTNQAVDHIASGLIRPWTSLVDIIKLLAGIVFPPAAIRPANVNGDNPVRYPKKEIAVEVEEEPQGSLQDALEDSPPSPEVYIN